MIVPPFADAGPPQAKLTLVALSALAAKPVGADAGPRGVKVISAEATDSPAALVAVTFTLYAVPFTKFWEPAWVTV